MPTNQSSDLVSLVASLQRSFNAKQFSSLPPLLTRAKLLLAASNALTPTANTSPSALHLARTVFEIGAYTSIQLQDQPAFVNYLGYLHNFFALGAGGEREAELTGLNLLRLLAENKIAEFHTTLEILGDSPVKGSEPVRFARGLEEWVMEGAYNRVWKAGEGDGVNDYQKFFLHVLMDTIRCKVSLIVWTDCVGTRLLLVWNELILRFPFQTVKLFYSSQHRAAFYSKNSLMPYDPSQWVY